MYVINKDSILEIVKQLDLIPLIKEGFIAYSEGRSVVPPIGELSFKNPPGDVHIKYGYIIGDSYYVIKIASGFWENENLGIPNGQGMMLLFDQKTGQPKAILLDNASLTDIRTAVAGQICAQQFSNDIKCIGVLGTGLQARLQVEYLTHVTDCRNLIVWGRNREKMKQYQKDMVHKGFKVNLADSVRQLSKSSNLIITATGSSEPMLFPEDIMPGTHITAMGSDTLMKRELGPGVLKVSSLVIADSITQCQERGEISHGLKEGDLSKDSVVELGDVLSGTRAGRTSQKDITVADLTGVAVQDIQIAIAVFKSYLENQK